ncbi:hypothetical protein R3P38DRAFT_332367 [Favolaschia claudopus]|uniref:Uncharacterized protein n=1 Tax=Favolaschia claudopus TaxID=2862362 RepID=A0AAV9ZNA0_9AGAR
MVWMFSRLLEYIRDDREKAHSVVRCVSSALLFCGSLNLMDRLRLIPIIALPFLSVPQLLAVHNTINLVDVTGQRTPIFLDVWRNQEAFITKMQDFFVSNEVIMNIVRSQQYQIQDAEYSVHLPGSRMVAAGVTLFMAAIFHRSQMNCPWCTCQVEPGLPGWNLQILLECKKCRRRFSASNLNSPIPVLASENAFISSYVRLRKESSNSGQEDASVDSEQVFDALNDAYGAEVQRKVTSPDGLLPDWPLLHASYTVPSSASSSSPPSLLPASSLSSMPSPFIISSSSPYIFSTTGTMPGLRMFAEQ